MKIKEIKKQLKWIGRVISRNPVVPILECVLIENGWMMASNLACWMKTPSDLWTEETGTFVVPHTMLGKIANSLPETSDLTISCVNLDKKVFALHIKVDGELKFKIEAANPDDFPKPPIEEGNQAFMSLKASDMANLKELISCTSHDELRPALQCVLFDAIQEKFVATDGYRMSFRPGPASVNPEWIKEHIMIPADAIKRMDHVQYDVFHSGAYFRLVDSNRQQIWFRSVDERFPEWEIFAYPDDKVTMYWEIGKAQLLDRLRQAITCIPKGYINQGVFFVPVGDKLIIYAIDKDFGNEFKDEIPIDVLNDKGSFGFCLNGPLLLDYLENSEAVTIKFKGASTTNAFWFNDDYLQMPIAWDGKMDEMKRF